MIKLNKLFPGGNKKAFTLSYDDGVAQDRRLIQILDKYNLKGTFNLNSGLQVKENSFTINDLIIKRINKKEILDLYNGHEVAIHGLTHLSLQDIPKELMVEEILQDKKNLERIFGYPVRGMAYPNGVYNKEIFKILEILGVAYARTVNNHKKFHLPLNFLEWNPTMHHDNPDLMKVAKCFVRDEFKSLSLFYLWGHSYEFDLNDNWGIMEEFCEYMGNREDIWYATNIEIVNYMNALDRLIFSVERTYVYNPSAVSVWLEIDKIAVEIKAGETKAFNRKG